MCLAVASPFQVVTVTDDWCWYVLLYFVIVHFLPTEFYNGTIMAIGNCWSRLKTVDSLSFVMLVITTWWYVVYYFVYLLFSFFFYLFVNFGIWFQPLPLDVLYSVILCWCIIFSFSFFWILILFLLLLGARYLWRCGGCPLKVAELPSMWCVSILQCWPHGCGCVCARVYTDAFCCDPVLVGPPYQS